MLKAYPLEWVFAIAGFEDDCFPFADDPDRSQFEPVEGFGYFTVRRGREQQLVVLASVDRLIK